jgi:hypothetical protein
MIDVYMDESGVHDGAPAVTSSAVWARPSVWGSWTRDWIKAKQPINIFHASECSGRTGEFKGWSRGQRDELVIKRLLPTFPAHKLHGRFGGIHKEALNRCLEAYPEIKREFGDPYFACIHWSFRRVCEYAMKHNHQRVSVIHEISDYQVDVKYVFEYTQRKFPDLEMTLRFGKKGDFVPLQAADLVAYEGYKFLEGGSAERKPIAALDPTGKRMMKSVYDKDAAPLLATRLRSELQPLIERRKASDNKSWLG